MKIIRTHFHLTHKTLFSGNTARILIILMEIIHPKHMDYFTAFVEPRICAVVYKTFLTPGHFSAILLILAKLIKIKQLNNKN